MKRGFIRAVFGDCKTGVLKTDIERIMNNKFNEPYQTYVFGHDNARYLWKLGIRCKLINEKPLVWDIKKYLMRHKLEAIRYAMEVDGYDEIVFLDWDTEPIKNVPANFWQKLGQKEVIQGCLYYTGKKKWACWRKTDANVLINSSFLYIRDKIIPSKIIKIWNNSPDDIWWRSNDERAIAQFIDDYTSGWIGTEKWFEKFEPIFSHLEKLSMYNEKRFKDQKDICFIHRWH